MDADFSHDPARCRPSWPRSSEGFDVSIGSRYVTGGAVPNWARHRHLLSQGGNRYASAVLGLHVADSTAGFRAYSAAIMRKLDLNLIRAEGYGFQIEMTYRAKQHGAADRRGAHHLRRPGGAGESKMSSRIVFEALALVTWWGLGRLVRGVCNAAASAGRRPPQAGRAGTSDPVRSA